MNEKAIVRRLAIQTCKMVECGKLIADGRLQKNPPELPMYPHPHFNTSDNPLNSLDFDWTDNFNYYYTCPEIIFLDPPSLVVQMFSIICCGFLLR